MYWNHRVFKETDTGFEGEVFEGYSIRETYYNDANEIIGWTADGIDPYGEDLEGLKETLQWMLEACDKPVLEIDPQDENKLLNAVQGAAYDHDEPFTTYSSIEELIDDLEWEEEPDDSEGGDS